MADSHWSLSFDVASAKAIMWLTSVGRDAELTSELDARLFDRYSRLAEYHLKRGHADKAKRFAAQAKKHRVVDEPADGPPVGGRPADGPPYAAAMAMPRPRRYVYTNAVSSHRLDHPDDVA
jgi:hypothetical protein